MASVSVRVQARSFSGPAGGGRFACCVLFFPPVPLQIHLLAVAERVSISEPPASFSSGLGVA